MLIYIYIYIYAYVYICVCACETGGCTGMLDELLGSHTKVAIIPTSQSTAKGCDPYLAQYWVQGDVSSDLPN